MLDKTTLPVIYHELMKAPSVKLPYCAWCGKNYPLNQHHMVFRSAGNLFKNGKKVEKPTVTLCGSGSLGCHGKAHQRKLHFKYEDGKLYGAEFKTATSYLDALKSHEWREIFLGGLEDFWY